MKIKTQDLIGPTLDWAVARCEGVDYAPRAGVDGIGIEFEATNFSTDWSQGGPIIEREVISVMPRAGHRPLGVQWAGERSGRPTSEQFLMFGPTPLIAAMRCYVASKLGDEVDVPGGGVMFGIQCRIFNNATNEWEWRWAKDPISRTPLRFATGDAAHVFKEREFPGKPLSQVRVAKYTEEMP